jgi:two-component system phosphate regulon sensor histidine kinase PhoR
MSLQPDFVLLLGILLGFLAAGVLGLLVAWRARAQASAREESVRLDEASRAETIAALRREATTLEAVVEALSDGVWLTDEEGVVRRTNRAMDRLLPANLSASGQRPLFLLRSEALHQAVERACQEGQSTEVELRLESPQRRVLAVRVAPLGSQRPGPSVAVFRDLTELRRLERVRQEFVANVSHELRTPITAILGYAETLLNGALEDRENAPQMVEIIHRQSERLSSLVDDLLELSRLEGREAAFGRTPLSVEAISQRAVEAVAPRAARKSISLDAEVPASLTALGDERALEQVLLNLLDNAVKYTPEGGRVRLTARPDGDRVRLCVADSGMGIAPQHLPRLFERFYRIDPGRSRDMGGTGLGLAIVKHLVSAMGGELQVASQPGEGSEFSVLLPQGGSLPAPQALD